jgi:dihydroorotate dehydrogenase (fumarate)
MANLKTRYMGIELKNPVIVGACNLVNNLDNVRKVEEAGAAAIVYKSLFEEQIQLESAQLDNKLEEYNERHAEMVKLFPSIQHAGPEEHLFNLALVKKTIKIPLIASLNAIFKETWIDYARRIEEMGVDALELNFYHVPRDVDFDGHNLITDQVDILKAVKKAVKIPVSVKLSPFYANPLNVVSQLDNAGANGVILFNRLFQPEIDMEKQEHFTPFNLSSPDDNRLPLRFAGLLHGNIKGSLCSSTGVFTGKDVAKMILAGADCVQVVSTIYKNKIGYISQIIKDLESWMDSKGYKSLDDFRGKLSNKNINNPFVYKRAQYIDLLLKSDEILINHPLR